MDIVICEDKQSLGRGAAATAAEIIRNALAAHGEATIVVATGASQFEMLASLVAAPDVDWSRVTAFHLDEYIGLPFAHPASFRKYLQERFVNELPNLRTFHYVNGEADDPAAECARLGDEIRGRTVDVACIGIGENGHVAFNDPPADFETTDPFLVVELDDACRRQQLNEGWFPTLDEVPTHAITMSPRQIMAGSRIVCTVPDKRKAKAVRNTVEGEVTPNVPASILQTHPACTLFLYEPAASKLSAPNREGAS